MVKHHRLTSSSLVSVLSILLLQFGGTHTMIRGGYAFPAPEITYVKSGVNLELRRIHGNLANEDKAESTSTVAIVSTVAAIAALVMTALTVTVCVYCCMVKYKMCTPIYDPIQNPPPNCRLYTYDFEDIDLERCPQPVDQTTLQSSRDFATSEIFETAPPPYHRALEVSMEVSPESDGSVHVSTHQISRTEEESVSSGNDELPKYEDVMDSFLARVPISQASCQDPVCSENISEEAGNCDGSADGNTLTQEGRSENLGSINQRQSIHDATL